ncbi:MAG: sugar ABC transporter permease [Clostridia bacterium]|nr:sugar ABC transporter permease [Bacteroidales bacterium]MBO7273427.1 sugar ABC transporter permease [Clostridia bacterium]
MTNDVNVSAVNVNVPKRKKRRKIASLDRRKARAGWFFVLPFLIGFVLIYLPIVWQSIEISFSKIQIGGASGSYDMIPVGFKNYIEAIQVDPQFTQVLVTGLGNLLIDIPAILIFSLFMAIMLNTKMVGRAVFRSIFFIPVVLSTGIMENIAALDVLTDYMESGEGIDDGSGQSKDALVSADDLALLFANMKVGTELVDIVTQMVNNIFEIVNRSGVQMLIFLAALQSISPAIYESCKIDGATAWETFWKITLPMISPMILVNGVYTIIDSFTTESNPVMVYIQSISSDFRERSTAMAWIYFAIVGLAVALIAAIMSGFVFYQRKND